ncbi:MAG: hypothetical protein JW904_07410 [Spirochaetales bacterium]|nr:hypothetical protein [Spirochaetales bacterium]
MKKTPVLLLLFLLFTSILFGNTKLKINPGTWLVGGGFSYAYAQTLEEYGSNLFNFDFSGIAGFFINPQTIVALSCNTSLNFSLNDGNFSWRLQSIGLQGRYLLSHTELINFYFGLGAAFGITYSLKDTTTAHDGWQGEKLIFFLPVGIYIPIISTIALDISIQPILAVPLNNTDPMGLVIPIYIGFAMFM